MSDTLTTIEGVKVLSCTPDGRKLKSEQDAVTLIGEAMQQGAELILLPVERLADDFFHLKTGLAGHLVQKCVTYRRHLVIVGDISGYLAQSRSFADFVSEANHGTQIWFLRDLQEFHERLKRIRYPTAEQERRSEREEA
jgi:hypothetical protein